MYEGTHRTSIRPKAWLENSFCSSILLSPDTKWFWTKDTVRYPTSTVPVIIYWGTQSKIWTKVTPQLLVSCMKLTQQPFSISCLCKIKSVTFMQWSHWSIQVLKLLKNNKETFNWLYQYHMVLVFGLQLKIEQLLTDRKNKSITTEEYEIL